jgi:hypothetical protein
MNDREELRLLNERDRERALLRTDVQAGFDQLARGEGRTYDKTTSGTLADRIKAGGRAARSESAEGPTT